MSKYWEKRIANSVWSNYNNSEEQVRELLKRYKKASEDINNELFKITGNVEELTLSEMHKKHRLETLKKGIDDIIVNLFKRTEKDFKSNAIKGVESISDNISQALGIVFYEPNEKLVNRILQEEWKGSNFSKRLWEKRRKLCKNLNIILRNGIIQGNTATHISIQLSRAMDKGFSVANRLVRTETMHIFNSSVLDRYVQAEIQEVEVLVAKDERTCEICGPMHEKKYPIDRCPSLPLHPNCRCTFAPVVIDEEEEISDIRSELQDSGIGYLDVKELPVQLTEKDIVLRLGGVDKTHGSCSSLAFAWIGNTHGLDVLDFRGGASETFFAKGDNINRIAKLKGVDSKVVKVQKEMNGVLELLKDMPFDKQYYLAVGKHAAIINRTQDKGFQFLELQGKQEDNGFHSLTKEILVNRFGVAKTQRMVYGNKVESTIQLIDVDSLGNSEEFRKILGYINTSVDKQFKGLGGYVK